MIRRPIRFLFDVPKIPCSAYSRYQSSPMSASEKNLDSYTLQVKQQDRSQLRAKQWWNGVRPEMRLAHGDKGPVAFTQKPSRVD